MDVAKGHHDFSASARGSSLDEIHGEESLYAKDTKAIFSYGFSSGASHGNLLRRWQSSVVVDGLSFRRDGDTHDHRGLGQ